jgi:hypothetical protein
MPDITTRVANLASGATVRPFAEGQATTWKFRRCPYAKGLYTILGRHDGAAGGLQWEIKIGTTEVLQRSDMSAGGTDGVMPTPQGNTSTPAHQFYANYNDEIDVTLFETGAVATTDVMIWANVEPAA